MMLISVVVVYSSFRECIVKNYLQKCFAWKINSQQYVTDDVLDCRLVYQIENCKDHSRSSLFNLGLF